MVLLDNLNGPIQFVMPQRTTGPGHLDFWFQPDLSIVLVILGTLADVYARVDLFQPMNFVISIS